MSSSSPTFEMAANITLNSSLLNIIIKSQGYRSFDEIKQHIISLEVGFKLSIVKKINECLIKVFEGSEEIILS